MRYRELNYDILSSLSILSLYDVIYVIEGDSNKVKIAPCKIKQPNLEFLKYIKGGKHPEEEVGKYIYAVIEGQNR